MRELKQHVMSGLAPSGARLLYDPISGVAASDAALASAVPGSALAYYFFRPSNTPSFNWEVTDGCSWRCAHCFQRTVSVPWEEGVELSGQQVDRAVELLRTSGAEEVSLTGGEPMLVRNLSHVLATLREALPKIRIRVLASGRRVLARQWTSATIEAARAVKATVRLPLYGSRAPTHDAITRTRGSFADVTGLAHALGSAGVRAIIGIGVFRETASELPATVELARSLSAEDVAVSSVLYPRKGSAHPAPGDAPESISASQLMKLLAWPTTAALATQYVSLEAHCASGCRYPTIDCRGKLHGCDVVDAVSASQDSWRDEVNDQPMGCAACELSSVCRTCLAFAGSGPCEVSHRSLVATAAYVVGRRAASAQVHGLRFEDARAEGLLGPFIPGSEVEVHRV